VENPVIHVEDTDRIGTNPKFFYSFPNSPYNASGAVSASSVSEDEGADDLIEFPGRRQRIEPTTSKWHSRRRRVWRQIRKFAKSFYEFMTVPLWAALLSLIVACIPVLQHALDTHVKPIRGALNQAGNCSIPLTLVVLGAYFYSPPDPEDSKARGPGTLPSTHEPRNGSFSTTWSQLSLADGVREIFKMKKRSSSTAATGKKNTRPGETKTVVIAILSRMIITPLLLLPVLALSTKFNLQDVFDE
jgi:auxin efflux carrier family protein